MTTANVLNLDDCPPGRPSLAQRQAAADAEHRARQLLALGPFHLRWARLPASAAAAQDGATRFPRGGPIVWLRDDLAPAGVYRIALHELAHVADAPIITEISEAEAERRAEAFVARALAKGTDPMSNDPRSDVRLAIANGTCGSCDGPIAAGTWYRRVEPDVPNIYGIGMNSHLHCPPVAANARLSVVEPDRYERVVAIARRPEPPRSTNGRPAMIVAPRLCICGGRITMWGAFDRCLSCGLSAR